MAAAGWKVLVCPECSREGTFHVEYLEHAQGRGVPFTFFRCAACGWNAELTEFLAEKTREMREYLDRHHREVSPMVEVKDGRVVRRVSKEERAYLVDCNYHEAVHIEAHFQGYEHSHVGVWLGHTPDQHLPAFPSLALHEISVRAAGERAKWSIMHPDGAGGIGMEEG